MKFFGKVGYGIPGEVQNGVWADTITEHFYYGDVERDSRRVVSADRVNSDISVSNTISILADPYALDHFHAIKYVEWAGALWDVEDVEARSPRLILRLGGVYDGPRPTGGEAPTDGSQTGAPEPPRRDSGR